MRPSVRFEIFKRDGFACAYCNRRPPDVTLEVDHIIPRAEDGGDEPENLVTACMDCNRGKGAVPLEQEPEAIPDIAARTELVREREAQLRAYHAALAQLRAYHAALEEASQRQDEQFGRVWNAWFAIWGETSMSRSLTPGKAALRRYIDQLGEPAVMLALEVVEEKFPHYPSSNAVRYLFGVLKRKLAQLDGREKACAVCGRYLVLEPGQDVTVDWMHGDCAEIGNG